MEVLYIIIVILVFYSVWVSIVHFKSNEPIKRATPQFHKYTALDLSKFSEPNKDIRKIGVILSQCDRWVSTNEHEMASIYYEVIANECKKLSEEHKRKIQ